MLPEEANLNFAQQSEAIKRDFLMFAKTSMIATATVNSLHHRSFKKKIHELHANPQKYSGFQKRTCQKICKSKNQNLHYREPAIYAVHLSIGRLSACIKRQIVITMEKRTFS